MTRQDDEMRDEDQFLGHEPHRYEALARGWERVAAKHGWECRRFAETDGYELLTVSCGSGGGFYASAGVHGDEAAGAWALLEWADREGARLQGRAFRFFPCLNPWGLDWNERQTADGRDLNRSFHDGGHPVVRAWREELGNQRFDVAVCLHEDYDARGMYLYELERGRREGEAILGECEGFMNRQPDGEVEGMETENGVMQVPRDLNVVLEEMGEQLPEAIYLYLHHTDWSLTFETPSELGWRERVLTQHRFLQALVRRCAAPAGEAGPGS